MEVDCNLKNMVSFFKFFLCVPEKSLKGRYVFYLGGGGGGGWAGASEGRTISKIFTNRGGPNLFCSPPGEGHTFFGKEKITPCRFY